MQTKVLNAEEVGFDNINLYFGKIYGEKHNRLGGLDGVPKKLDIV